MSESAFPQSSGTSQGLTKLEYFAAAAMQGILSNKKGYELTVDQLAGEAVACAKELMAELYIEASR